MMMFVSATGCGKYLYSEGVTIQRNFTMSAAIVESDIIYTTNCFQVRYDVLFTAGDIWQQ